MSSCGQRSDIAVVFSTDRVADGGISSLCQLLPHLSPDPVLVTQSLAPCLAAWVDQGRTLRVIPAGVGPGRTRGVGAWTRLWDILRFNAAIYRLCIRSRPRVVHCNDPLAIQHAAFGAMAAGVFVAVHLRDTKQAISHSERWKWRLYLSLCDRIICLSRDMVGRWSRAIGGCDLRGRDIATIASVSYSVVDTARFAPADPSERPRLREGLGLPGDAFIILAVGIVSEKKGSLALVRDIAPQLGGRSTVLVLVGDTHTDAEISASVRQLAAASSGRVVIAGAHRDIERWYQAADVCVNNARFEGLARCMLESLACGVPVVSTDVCSACEILVEHTCGIVVAGDNPASMAEAIEVYRLDSERRRDDGERGLQLVRRLCSAPSVARRANQGLPS